MTASISFILLLVAIILEVVYAFLVMFDIPKSQVIFAVAMAFFMASFVHQGG